jgi:hypothetical protein
VSLLRCSQRANPTGVGLRSGCSGGTHRKEPRKLCRVLGLPVPEEAYETGDCSPSHKENLSEAGKREERALHLYRKYLDEATEERVKEVLEAFIEVESDHLGLTT